MWYTSNLTKASRFIFRVVIRIISLINALSINASTINYVKVCIKTSSLINVLSVNSSTINFARYSIRIISRCSLTPPPLITLGLAPWSFLQVSRCPLVPPLPPLLPSPWPSTPLSLPPPKAPVTLQNGLTYKKNIFHLWRKAETYIRKHINTHTHT